jgi:hypothetical protein
LVKGRAALFQVFRFSSKFLHVFLSTNVIARL